MNISRLAILLASLLAVFASATELYGSKYHIPSGTVDDMAISCFNANPSLFRNVDGSGTTLRCLSTRSDGFEFWGANGETNYKDLFHGLDNAIEKIKHSREVKQTLEIMINDGVQESSDTHLIEKILVNNLGLDLALKALRSGASPLKERGSVLDHRVFSRLIEGDKDALEFIKEVIVHPEMKEELSKSWNPLEDLSFYYDGGPASKEVLNLLIRSGAKISYEIMSMWAYRSLLQFQTYYQGFSDFVHAVPNPYTVDNGKGFEDALEEAHENIGNKMMSEYLLQDPVFSLFIERKAFGYKALTDARSNKPAIFNPDGRRITLRFRLPATRVFVTGSFDHWKQTIEMSHENDGTFYKDFMLDEDRAYQFKFVADGNWIATDDYATTNDGNGNINNII